jgi:hypothetical protein
MRWPVMMAETGGEGGGSAAVAEAPASNGVSREAQLDTAGQSGGLLDWRTRLPENLRNADIIKQHPTPEAAARTLQAQAEMIGRGIFLPTDAPDTPEYAEKMGKIYARLGRPDTADKYELPTIDGYSLEPETEKEFRREAHMAGLSQAQVEKLIQFDARRLKALSNRYEAMAAQSEIDGRNRLMAEFGASTDAVMSQAQGFFTHFGAGAFGGEAGKLAWQAILDARLPDGSLLRNNPHLIASFAEAGKAIGEGEWYDSQHYQPGQNTEATLTARQKELTAKRHSPEGLTAEEWGTLQQINQQLLNARERAGRTPLRRSA